MTPEALSSALSDKMSHVSDNKCIDYDEKEDSSSSAFALSSYINRHANGISARMLSFVSYYNKQENPRDGARPNTSKKL